MLWRLLVFSVLLTARLHAQDSNRVRTAREILIAGRYEDALLATKAAFVQRLHANTLWEPYQDILQEWADSIYNWPSLAASLSAELSQSFAQDELDTILAFYRSPGGAKYMAWKVRFNTEFAQWIASNDARFRPSLVTKLRTRAAQLQAPLPPLKSD